jgi:hypothetical protein
MFNHLKKQKPAKAQFFIAELSGSMEIPAKMHLFSPKTRVLRKVA